MRTSICISENEGDILNRGNSKGFQIREGIKSTACRESIRDFVCLGAGCVGRRAV